MLLTMKEVNRLRVLQGYMDGKILIREAARILERSLRSVYRMLAKVREKGPEGVLHGNRNKVSPRRVPEAVRKKVIGLALGKYRDINDTHLCEILSKAEGIVMGRETLRGILRKEGLPSKRTVKRRKYRSRRERKAHGIGRRAFLLYRRNRGLSGSFSAWSSRGLDRRVSGRGLFCGRPEPPHSTHEFLDGEKGNSKI